MRELKFRAWDIPDLDLELEGVVTYSRDCDCLRHFFSMIHDNHLMQYTGLKDKNGVEIYEGDIVNLPTDGEFSPVEITFTVDRDFNGWEVLPQHIEDGAEVIGNIYENPELLGAKDE